MFFCVNLCCNFKARRRRQSFILTGEYTRDETGKEVASSKVTITGCGEDSKQANFELLKSAERSTNLQTRISFKSFPASQ
jgi:hypothetical protein